MTTCSTAEVITLNYVENDNLPALQITYKDTDGNPVDITGYTFSLHVAFEAGAKTVAGSIVGAPTDGVFEFEYPDSWLTPSGIFEAEVQITDAGGKKLTIQGFSFDIAAEIA